MHIQGHGEYTEIDEKEFFEVVKKSKDVVCLFYKDGSPRCNIADHHLKILAKKHVEAKFIRLNVERAPFLTGMNVYLRFPHALLVLLYCCLPATAIILVALA